MEQGAWVPVCPPDELPEHRGVTVLAHGTAIAVFRTADGAVYALGNHEPGTRSGVLARGILGVADGVPFVGIREHRLRIDLRTGAGLDDAGVQVPSYPVRVVDGVVHVGPREG